MDIEAMADDTVVKYGNYYTTMRLVRSVMTEKGIPITERNIERLLVASVQIEDEIRAKNNIIP